MSTQVELIDTANIPDPLNVKDTEQSVAELRDEFITHFKMAKKKGFEALESYAKCGEVLLKLKATYSHGLLYSYLSMKVRHVSDRQCRNYMRLAKNWDRNKFKKLSQQWKASDGRPYSLTQALKDISESEPARSKRKCTSVLTESQDASSVATDETTQQQPTVNTDLSGTIEDSNGIAHSGIANVPNTAPPSRRVGKVTAKAEGTGRESRPQEPETSQTKQHVDQADSVVRYAIPGIQDAARSLDEFLVQHGQTGVDTERVKVLLKELNKIFFAAKKEVSQCK